MIGLRLKELRTKKGYNMRQMAAALNLPYTTYVNYEKEAREPNSEQIVLISKYFGVTADYLLGRSDVANFSDEQSIMDEYPEIKPIKKKKLPLLGKVACGEPIFDEEIDTYIEASTDIDADFCLICKGDSMINARIHDGDVVFIKQTDVVDNGNIAAVVIDGELTLKRVYYYPEKNKLILNPENPAYEPFVYVNEELNSIRILGRAVAFMSLAR